MRRVGFGAQAESAHSSVRRERRGVGPLVWFLLAASGGALALQTFGALPTDAIAPAFGDGEIDAVWSSIERAAQDAPAGVVALIASVAAIAVVFAGARRSGGRRPSARPAPDTAASETKPAPATPARVGPWSRRSPSRAERSQPLQPGPAPASADDAAARAPKRRAATIVGAVIALPFFIGAALSLLSNGALSVAAIAAGDYETAIGSVFLTLISGAFALALGDVIRRAIFDA